MLFYKRKSRQLVLPGIFIRNLSRILKLVSALLVQVEHDSQSACGQAQNSHGNEDIIAGLGVGGVGSVFVSAALAGTADEDFVWIILFTSNEVFDLVGLTTIEVITHFLVSEHLHGGNIVILLDSLQNIFVGNEVTGTEAFNANREVVGPGLAGVNVDDGQLLGGVKIDVNLILIADSHTGTDIFVFLIVVQIIYGFAPVQGLELVVGENSVQVVLIGSDNLVDFGAAGQAGDGIQKSGFKLGFMDPDSCINLQRMRTGGDVGIGAVVIVRTCASAGTGTGRAGVAGIGRGLLSLVDGIVSDRFLHGHLNNVLQGAASGSAGVLGPAQELLGSGIANLVQEGIIGAIGEARCLNGMIVLNAQMPEILVAVDAEINFVGTSFRGSAASSSALAVGAIIMALYSIQLSTTGSTGLCSGAGGSGTGGVARSRTFGLATEEQVLAVVQVAAFQE